MNKFNAFIEKRNFKRIFIVYVISAVVCGTFELERAENGKFLQNSKNPDAATLSSIA